MRVEIGPVPSDSVLMWIAFARTILAQIITQPGAYGTELSEVELGAFEAYLDEWELGANRGHIFHWSTDADPDKVKRLADTWLKLAEGMARAAELRGYEIQPPEGRPFNDALVVAVLEALGREGLA